MKQIADI